MKRIIRIIFFSLLCISFLYCEKEELLVLKVKRKIEEVSQRLDGILGLAVKDLKNDRTFLINEK